MIEIHRVTKRFGDVVALDDVSLRIEAGERVAFVGTNGSGKTTLLRALLGLVRVGGHITVDGADPAKAPERALARVAYVPQIAPPLDASVAEVVRAFASLRKIADGAVAERADRLGVDLASVRRTRFRDLSGGQKQKVLAAMALATEAPVLVCDEPTANLDAAARAAFFDEVARRSEDRILVLCSHRVEEVRRLVRRVVELREGRVERDLRSSDLLASMRTCHVEIELGEGSRSARAYLERHGFVEVGPERLAADLTQEEKLETLRGLMSEHASAVRDVDAASAGMLRPDLESSGVRDRCRRAAS
jgi:ABC-type multidrug transport system ATPase subunit